jgi:FkbM family methyltransferase
VSTEPDAQPLIVDVGMHRGEDTAFYLAKGFRVLAVEANPDLAALGRQRFADDIAAGRLTVRETAIAEEDGTVSFFVGEQDGWGSLDQRRAGSNLNVPTREVTVEACTFEQLLEGLSPYYVKVDIEGADLTCVEAMARVADPPAYFSFECDLTKPAETQAGVRVLAHRGYTRFKLVNQALNPQVRCPSPPREGRFVDVTFTHDMSGPFGEETPGDWMDLPQILERFTRLADQQAVRASYAETGRVFGLPLGRFHRVLKTAYNVAPVRVARRRWAAARGNEVGGWFDLHAAR